MVKEHHSNLSTFQGDLFEAICEKVAAAVFAKINEQLTHHAQTISPTASANRHQLYDEEDEELITKSEACHLLQRCESTLTNWAQRGILLPIRRGGHLYYRRGDVMKMYKGIL
jgi:hypothetical protein